MIGPDDGIRILAPLAFKAADKFFKFVTWAFALTALRFAASATSSTPLSVIAWVATTVFTVTLLMQSMYLAMRHPSTLGIPEEWYARSQVVQILLGLMLFLAIGSPALYLDQVFEALAQVRPK